MRRTWGDEELIEENKNEIRNRRINNNNNNKKKKTDLT